MRLILYSIFTMLGMCVIYTHVKSQDRDSTLINLSESNIRVCNVRPTFFEMSVRTLPAINQYPVATNVTDGRFKSNKLYNFKLNVPIILSQKLDIISQLRYKNEELNLGGFSEVNEKEIHFDNLGMSIMFKYKFDNTYFIAGHLGGFFKADGSIAPEQIVI